MSKSNLVLFKEKYKVGDNFIESFETFVSKLVEFGYIPSSKVNNMIQKFFSNVKEIRFGSKNRYDYKSGYYDANKKELYIKDESNYSALYLRLLYAFTTKEIEQDSYMIGYSTTKLRKDSYKLSYENYGINRAIMANLVCKLNDLVPFSLRLTPGHKTYTHDFLGFKIESTNDIYSLEGKLLSELCYCLDIDPEILYSGLFTKKPIKILNDIFNKKKFEKKDEFLALFDKISKEYNTYNKLAYLSTMLNENYIDYKKHVLADNVENIKKEQEKIEEQIISTLNYLYGNEDTASDDEDFNLSASLSEALENLEKSIKKDLIKYQDILADNIIKTSSSMPYTKYASKLKCFNDILIVPNKKICEAISDIILFKLMPEDEITGINLIQKIKYAIIENILSNNESTDISNTFSFYNIDSLETNNSALIILNSGTSLYKLIEVKGLNENIKNSERFKLNYIQIDNLKYIMDSNYSNVFVGDVERLYTALKNSFDIFYNVPLDNIYVFEYEGKNYLAIYSENHIYVVSFDYTVKEYGFGLLNLSEEYKVFGKTVIKKKIFRSNLPVLSR